MRGQPRRPQADTASVRDAALIRISRTRRLVLAGAAALTAGLAALASVLLPGKSFAAGSHTASETATGQSASSTSSVSPPLPAPANAAQLGVASSGQAAQPAPQPTPQPTPQPQAAPQPAPAPAPTAGGSAVVSGGS